MSFNVTSCIFKGCYQGKIVYLSINSHILYVTLFSVCSTFVFVRNVLFVLRFRLLFLAPQMRLTIFAHFCKLASSLGYECPAKHTQSRGTMLSELGQKFKERNSAFIEISLNLIVCFNIVWQIYA